MDVDAIARASMSLSSARMEEAVEVAMLKKAMEMEQMIAAQLIQSLQAVPPPPVSFGHKLDVLV